MTPVNETAQALLPRMQSFLNTFKDLEEAGNRVLSHTSSLDQLQLVERSCIGHFLRWVVYIITFGQVSYNPQLEQKAKEVAECVSQMFDIYPASQNRGTALWFRKALLNFSAMCDKNFAPKAVNLIQEILSTKLVMSEIPQLPISQAIIPSETPQPSISEASSSSENPPPSISETPQLPITPVTCQEEIEKASKVDAPLIVTTWDSAKSEKLQTFDAYIASPAVALHRTHPSELQIYLFKTIEEPQKKILQVAKDYLQEFYAIPTLMTEELTLDATQRRKAKYDKKYNLMILQEPIADSTGVITQYHIQDQINVIRNKVIKRMQETTQPKVVYGLGFTAEDLYADGFNFVVGVGVGCRFGAFSIHRHQDNATNDQLLIRRILQLASHEFGHMLALDHCLSAACCMQGSNSLAESDRLPITFCASCMGKVAHTTKRSLQQCYQAVRDFFHNFSSKYSYVVDFSTEISLLDKRIARLTA